MQSLRKLFEPVTRDTLKIRAKLKLIAAQATKANTSSAKQYERCNTLDIDLREVQAKLDVEAASPVEEVNSVRRIKNGALGHQQGEPGKTGVNG